MIGGWEVWWGACALVCLLRFLGGRLMASPPPPHWMPLPPPSPYQRRTP